MPVKCANGVAVASRWRLPGQALLIALVAAAGGCSRCSESAPGREGGSAAVSVSSGSPPAGAASSRATSRPTPAPDSNGLLEGYALDKPDDEHELPEDLTEVSGITALSDTEVACIQDEKGSIYLYDLGKKSIVREIPFGPKGDYEGIARVQANLYVLRSDGMIFEIADYAAARPKMRSVVNRMPTEDNEGLAFDPFAATLLIAPKSRPAEQEAASRTQVLFKYDSTAGRVDASPVVTFDLDNVFDGTKKEEKPEKAKKEKKHKEKKGDEGKKKKRKIEPSRFLPSDVAVHPKTGHYFLISSVGNNLAVFDRQGNLKGQHPLNVVQFPQPEGIAFTPNNDLLITSEGAGRRGKLFRFRYAP